MAARKITFFIFFRATFLLFPSPSRTVLWRTQSEGFCSFLFFQWNYVPENFPSFLSYLLRKLENQLRIFCVDFD